MITSRQPLSFSNQERVHQVSDGYQIHAVMGVYVEEKIISNRHFKLINVRNGFPFHLDLFFKCTDSLAYTRLDFSHAQFELNKGCQCNNSQHPYYPNINLACVERGKQCQTFILQFGFWFTGQTLYKKMLRAIQCTHSSF